ncbi:hypothetical protein B0E47_15360 [Rhodanobacter sp. B05]|nr:hypothetical protein B0E47_15360 [Rhodanobacter sp. B05]
MGPRAQAVDIAQLAQRSGFARFGFQAGLAGCGRVVQSMQLHQRVALSAQSLAWQPDNPVAATRATPITACFMFRPPGFPIQHICRAATPKAGHHPGDSSAAITPPGAIGT